MRMIDGGRVQELYFLPAAVACTLPEQFIGGCKVQAKAGAALLQ